MSLFKVLQHRWINTRDQYVVQTLVTGIKKMLAAWKISLQANGPARYNNGIFWIKIERSEPEVNAQVFCALPHSSSSPYVALSSAISNNPSITLVTQTMQYAKLYFQSHLSNIVQTFIISFFCANLNDFVEYQCLRFYFNFSNVMP